MFSGRSAILRRRSRRRRRRFIHSFLRRGSDLHSFCGKTTLQGAMSAVRLPPLALSVPAQICNVATNRPMRRAAENGMYVCVCVCMYVSLFRAVDLEAKFLKEECCAIMYEKVRAVRRFERIDVRANGNVLSLGMH